MTANPSLPDDHPLKNQVIDPDDKMMTRATKERWARLILATKYPGGADAVLPDGTLHPYVSQFLQLFKTNSEKIFAYVLKLDADPNAGASSQSEGEEAEASSKPKPKPAAKSKTPAKRGDTPAASDETRPQAPSSALRASTHLALEPPPGVFTPRPNDRPVSAPAEGSSKPFSPSAMLRAAVNGSAETAEYAKTILDGIAEGMPEEYCVVQTTSIFTGAPPIVVQQDIKFLVALRMREGDTPHFRQLGMDKLKLIARAHELAATSKPQTGVTPTGGAPATTVPRDTCAIMVRRHMGTLEEFRISADAKNLWLHGAHDVVVPESVRKAVAAFIERNRDLTDAISTVSPDDKLDLLEPGSSWRAIVLQNLRVAWHEMAILLVCRLIGPILAMRGLSNNIPFEKLRAIAFVVTSIALTDNRGFNAELTKFCTELAKARSLTSFSDLPWDELAVGLLSDDKAMTSALAAAESSCPIAHTSSQPHTRSIDVFTKELPPMPNLGDSEEVRRKSAVCFRCGMYGHEITLCKSTEEMPPLMQRAVRVYVTSLMKKPVQPPPVKRPPQNRFGTKRAPPPPRVDESHRRQNSPNRRRDRSRSRTRSRSRDKKRHRSESRRQKQRESSSPDPVIDNNDKATPAKASKARKT